MAANPQAVAGTVPTVKLLINGQFVESKAKAWRDVVNPATQEVLARVPMCDADEVDASGRGGRRGLQDLEEHARSARAPASCSSSRS